MNLKDLFTENKTLQTKKIFSSTDGVTSIQLNAEALLKEHVTQVPALLVCVTGEVVFENETGVKEKLLPGDYVNITPEVKHSHTHCQAALAALIQSQAKSVLNVV